MAKIQADVPTEHGSRYLQQLCKHWSHKFEVTFDPLHGTIQLPTALCTLDAVPEKLSLLLEGEADVLPRMGEVVADHLKRFGFREELQIDWRPTD